MGLRKAGKEEHDYMSVRTTNGIKGFFLGMVFLSHIWTYTDFSQPYLDGLYRNPVRGRTGQCIVTMFLFYSGYGIMESVKKKGREYVDRIPIQRFLKVLLQFDCAIVLFWIYRYLTGAHYGIRKMLLTFAGWDGIGNSNWYIFCVLWLYIFTFVSFKAFPNSHTKAVFGILALSLLYMTVMYRLGRDYWWYDTILCYTWGMFFSLYRGKIEALVNESFASWMFFVFVLLAGHTVAYYYRNVNPVVYQLWVFCFVAAIVAFTMRFVIDSPFLYEGGVYLFELYILQRLPMMILKPYMLSGEVTALGKYCYVAACFVVTIGIAVVYKKTFGKAIGKITSGLQKNIGGNGKDEQ